MAYSADVAAGPARAHHQVVRRGYGCGEGRRRRVDRRRRPRVHDPARPVGVRQEHAAAHDRRAGGADQRRHLHRRHDGQRRAPKERDVAMVFQSYALYPHKTVQANIEFPLKVRGESKAERAGQGRVGRRGVGPDRVPRPQAGSAQRRPAPAGRAGPRHRAPAGGVLHGRAAVATSTPSCAARPAPSWSPSTAGSTRRSSTSPTIRSRR